MFADSFTYGLFFKKINIRDQNFWETETTEEFNGR